MSKVNQNQNLFSFLNKKELFYDKIDYNVILQSWNILKHHITLPYVIHIVGTNGKGSTWRYLAHILYEKKYKVLHYSSPHILEFNERIWINGKDSTNEQLESAHIKLQKILPNLRILVLHAKLTPSQIEKGLIDFINGEYDLALTTTIVESGIHIPNVNTVIVENADKFGIADLHQIRGRVGRGKFEGYAYFLVKNKDALSEDAKKRLLALEENSFLGSGQVLAMRDLEIRGGGNILGAEQSGQIKGVGYSMYVKMLENTLKELAGEKTIDTKTEVKLNINAYISDEVVKEDRLRLDLYKRFSNASSLKEIYELEKEMIDRFSKLDTPTKNFIEKMKIKVLAKEQNIKSISNYSENITIIYDEDKKEFFKAEAKDDEIILESILKN